MIVTLQATDIANGGEKMGNIAGPGVCFSSGGSQTEQPAVGRQLGKQLPVELEAPQYRPMTVFPQARQAVERLKASLA